MKYITVEQFLKANKEVQKAILKWWKPSVGDIYCNLYNNQQDNVIVINKCNFNFLSFAEDIKRYGVPLLTEGQLIDFIEDATGWAIEISFNIYNKYCFSFIDITGLTNFKTIETRTRDLLQALWQVANEIIK